jgi:hypothetical protein
MGRYAESLKWGGWKTQAGETTVLQWMKTPLDGYKSGPRTHGDEPVHNGVEEDPVDDALLYAMSTQLWSSHLHL